MSLVKWTTHSLAHLVKALSQQGHSIKKSALAELLHEQGYSLKVNKKTMEGKAHPDRDQQFGYIKTRCQEFEKHHRPIISVDCKKKELLVNQVIQGTDSSLRDYASYVPVGHAVEKIRKWQEQGADICYLSSHESR